MAEDYDRVYEAILQAKSATIDQLRSSAIIARDMGTRMLTGFRRRALSRKVAKVAAVKKSTARSESRSCGCSAKEPTNNRPLNWRASAVSRSMVNPTSTCHRPCGGCSD